MQYGTGRSTAAAPDTTMSNDSAAKLSIYAALASNVAIAIIKFIAAGITSSSAMLSEGLHSLVDSANELLLMYGVKRAARPPDVRQPFGYGRELYFWSFIVALLVLVLGAAASLYEGLRHIRSPPRLSDPMINYVVLGLSFVFEAVSWRFGLKAFQESKGHRGYLQALRRAKDPTKFTVLVEDTAALLGIVLAAAGIGAAQAFSAPWLDGLASVGIGLLLLASSLLLARETKSLLIGESADSSLHDSILRIVNSDEDVRHANGVFTVQLGAEQVLAALSVDFEDILTTTQIENCINRLEAAIRRGHPEIVALFVKPQTSAIWRERVGRLSAADQ